MPASGRAPLRNWSAASRGDGPTAPPAGRGRGPPSSVNLSTWYRAILLQLRTLELLTPLQLPLPLSAPVAGAAAASHALDCPEESPVTRHHEFTELPMQDV